MERLVDGYQKGVCEKYGEALDGCQKMENTLLQRYITIMDFALTYSCMYLYAQTLYGLSGFLRWYQRCNNDDLT